MRRVNGCVAAAALAGLIGSGVYAADVLSQLGITQARAEDAVGAVLNYGLANPGLPSAAFKAMSPSTRAGVATAGVAWVRSYISSAEFRKMYAQLREGRKPSPPEYKTTPEEELKAQAPKTASDADMQKMLATLSPEQRKEVEATMKRVAAQLAAMDTPENRNLRLDAIKSEREQRQKRYEEEVVNWQKALPVDPKPLIIERLKAFLALSADVDFGAATTSSGGRVAFVKPEYERKPESWKLCFRAGKEATMAARAGVEAWLKTLAG